MDWRLRSPYVWMCLDVQALALDGFRIVGVEDLPMAADAGSGLPVALSCACVLSLTKAADTGSFLLIDLRSQQCFRRGHLSGSHCIPSGLLLSGEPPEGELILISETPHEAVAVIEALYEAGYHRRLHYLGEGLAGWRASGLPIQMAVEPGPSGLLSALVLGLVGTGLLLAAAVLSSLPLHALGLSLLWGAWIEPSLPGPLRRQRLT